MVIQIKRTHYSRNPARTYIDETDTEQTLSPQQLNKDRVFDTHINDVINRIDKACDTTPLTTSLKEVKAKLREKYNLFKRSYSNCPQYYARKRIFTQRIFNTYSDAQQTSPTIDISNQTFFFKYHIEEVAKRIFIYKSEEQLEEANLDWIFNINTTPSTKENNFIESWFGKKIFSEDKKSTLKRILEHYKENVFPLKTYLTELKKQQFLEKTTMILEDKPPFKYEVKYWKLDKIKEYITEAQQTLLEIEENDTPESTYRKNKLCSNIDTAKRRSLLYRNEQIETVSIATFPSFRHRDENHDRIIVFKLGESLVTIVCDGVSVCGDPANPITGESAAHIITENIEYYLQQDNDLIEYLEELNEIHVDDKAGITHHVTNIANCITTGLIEIAKKIIPKLSSTTFEMNIQTMIGGKQHLITFSIGDSQTIIYSPNPDSDTPISQIKLMNPHMYAPTPNPNNTPIYYQDLQQRRRLFHNMSEPGQIITGDSKQLTPHVVIEKLNPGDIILTCSDGFTDNASKFRTINNKHCSMVDKETILTWIQKGPLNEPENMAYYLMDKAIIANHKIDDTTVCISFVK